MTNVRQRKMEDLLTAILDCGYADLQMLFDSKYDMYDIVEYAKDNLDFGNSADSLDINVLIQAMIELALGEIQDYIDEQDLEVELDIWDDTDIFLNYLDTHVYIYGDKIDAYKRYVPEIFDMFEEKTGIILQ